MILAYSCCNVSVLPLRKEPGHRSEQVSQLLFGERAEVLEIDGREWARIVTEWDRYEGWCRASQLSMLSKKEYGKGSKFFSGKNTDKIIFEDSEMWLPIGSELLKSKLTIGLNTGQFKGKKLLPVVNQATGDAVLKNGLQFLHAPYQWGGKTIAGIDCSGLSQMAYKLCNIKIARDASQQALQGEMVDFLQHARCGDLAFFDNSEGHINHVGILIDSQRILHATDTSGRVVIDAIDQGGIISKTLRKRTHNLRVVKRYLQQP